MLQVKKTPEWKSPAVLFWLKAERKQTVHPYLGVVDVQSLPVQQIRQSLGAIPHDDPLTPKHGEYCNNAKKYSQREKQTLPPAESGLITRWVETNHTQSRD